MPVTPQVRLLSGILAASPSATASPATLELEGADHRDRSVVHDQDTTRQNDVVVTGWEPLRSTYRQWLFDSPALLRQIHLALGR